MSTLHDTLADVPLFAGLAPDEVDRLAEIGRVEYFQRSSMVLSEGDSGPRLLIVLDGEVEILRIDDGLERSA